MKCLRKVVQTYLYAQFRTHWHIVKHWQFPKPSQEYDIGRYVRTYIRYLKIGSLYSQTFSIHWRIVKHWYILKCSQELAYGSLTWMNIYYT